MKLRHSYAAAVALCVILLNGLSGALESTPCDWLVAVFLESDGGLRASLEGDLRELTNAPKPRGKCVNIVVQFDHLGQVERRVRDWTRKAPMPPLAEGVEMAGDLLDKYWRPIEGSNTHLANLWVEGALSSFVLESARDYPSSKLALIVGSHGDAARSAPAGGASLQLSGDGARSLGASSHALLNRQLGREVDLILSSLPSDTKLELVGLDACQLAAIEAQYEFGIASSRAKLDVRVVASQDNQGGPGWFYEDLIGQLGSVNSGAEFASLIVDQAKVAWLKWTSLDRTYGTLSHVQAMQVSGVADAMNELGEGLLSEANIPGNRLTILGAVQDARCACRKFPGTEHGNASLVDSACLLQQLATHRNLDERLHLGALTALQRVRLAVKASAPNPCESVSNCGHGLSVFLPPPNASLSGYARDQQAPPRFVVPELQSKAAGWAEWIRYWASNMGQAAPKCGM